MPGFDGSGPRGQGPRTGGGFGFCPPGAEAGLPAAPIGVGQGGPPRGGGRGRAWGGGRGQGRGLFGPRWSGGVPNVTRQDEAAFLNNQAAALENELSIVRERLAALEKEVEKK